MAAKHVHLWHPITTCFLVSCSRLDATDGNIHSLRPMLPSSKYKTVLHRNSNFCNVIFYLLFIHFLTLFILLLKLVDGLIGFNKPEVAREEGQKDEISPQMLKVVDRIEKQDVK